jgi:hypothetical protein
MTMHTGILRGRLAPLLLFHPLLAGLSCSTVPLTGRKQLNLVPELEMLSTSFQYYRPAR